MYKNSSFINNKLLSNEAFKKTIKKEIWGKKLKIK